MQDSMVTVYLSLGSNLGDCLANLDQAVEDLESIGARVSKRSSVYTTEPVGYRDQPWFLNMAVESQTELSPENLLRACQEIEHTRGRLRTFPGAPRTIDLDILLFGRLVVEEPLLKIPHPRLPERRFVLEPLAEIAPGVVHPVLGVTIAVLRDRCVDKSQVALYPHGGIAHGAFHSH